MCLGVNMVTIVECNNEDILLGENETPISERSTLVLNAMTHTETRISLGDKENGAYPVLWQDGDALGLYSHTAGADISNVEALLAGESIGKNKGIFTAGDIALA